MGILQVSGVREVRARDRPDGHPGITAADHGDFSGLQVGGQRFHPALFQGEAIRFEGETLIDDGPTLNAIATLLKVSERLSKLLGLDAPAKVEADTTVKYTLNGIDMTGTDGL